MLIPGRLEDFVQLNNSMKPASPALKKKKHQAGSVVQVTLEQGA